MTKHSYSSFTEIDQHLKVLWLQKEIDHENIKLSLHKSKNYLCPTNRLTSIGTSGGFADLLQNLIMPLVTNILITKFLRKKSID